MIHTTRNQCELWFLAVLPGLVTLMLAIVCLLPKHIATLAQVMPLLPAAPIYYWSMREAREMPYWFVFVLALAMDAVSGLPMGMSSLLYLLLLALVHRRRKYIHKDGFLVKWTTFAGMLAVVCILSWLLVGFVQGKMTGFFPALVQWLLTVCCYPPLHKVFDLLYDHIHARRWQIMHGN